MNNSDNKTSLILHGHFYQPPRENPLTGVIPKQSSAFPYEDWNERIFNDCYDANTHSRYLSPDGKIISLTNNYSYISFNFGPTLLHFLDEKHPDMVSMLREADAESIKRLGHGNAMAQSFNHTILPLDQEKDAVYQIEWGYKDFEYHFRRKPEGMWLPECAINTKVIDLVAEAGIKFVVLSPWQCRAIEEDGKLIELEGKPAPYNEPFLLQGDKGGEIAAFFYHPGLAERISFGHLLQSADNMYSYLLEIRDSDKNMLIHSATDGEIYGHHEPYGDMALAALIRKVEERNDFIFDNYGSYLSKHPAVKHAVLHRGEEGKGTSWSCSHGVSRWYKDCGCHTGGEDGWNQEWRTPLRNSLNNLSIKLDTIFEREISRIFKNQLSSEKLLSYASDTFIGKKTVKDLLSELHRIEDFSNEEDNAIANLLSGIKNKHFSFTSCGFFFSDISGIEPRQDINYALYAIKMFQPFAKEDLLLPFLSDLKDAKSNIKSIGNGMSIAQDEMKEIPGDTEAALYFFLNRLLANETDWKKRYGRFLLSSYSAYDERTNIIVKDIESLSSSDFSILGGSSIESGVNIYISKKDNDEYPIAHYRITNNEIPPRILDESYVWIDHAISGISFDELMKLSSHMSFYSMLIKDADNLPMQTQLLENLGFTLKLIKSAFVRGHERRYLPNRRVIIGNMIDFVKKFGRTSDIDSVRQILTDNTESLCHLVKNNGLTDEVSNYILDILSLARRHGFEPDAKNLQNSIYPYYAEEKYSNTKSELRERVFAELNFA